VGEPRAGVPGPIRRITPKPPMWTTHGSRTPSAGTCGRTSAQAREKNTAVNMREDSKTGDRDGRFCQPSSVILRRGGEVRWEVEKADSPRRSNRLSAARRREWVRPEVFGFVGDSTRGGDRRNGGVGVNYWGLHFRRGKNWLPKSNANTNSRMENSPRRGFSSLLTTRGNS